MIHPQISKQKSFLLKIDMINLKVYAKKCDNKLINNNNNKIN